MTTARIDTVGGLACDGDNGMDDGAVCLLLQSVTRALEQQRESKRISPKHVLLNQ